MSVPLLSSLPSVAPDTPAYEVRVRASALLPRLMLLTLPAPATPSSHRGAHAGSALQHLPGSLTSSHTQPRVPETRARGHGRRAVAQLAWLSSLCPDEMLRASGRLQDLRKWVLE